MADGINQASIRVLGQVLSALPGKAGVSPVGGAAPVVRPQDAYFRQDGSADMQALAAIVAELTQRVAAMETRMDAMVDGETYAPASLPPAPPPPPLNNSLPALNAPPANNALPALNAPPTVPSLPALDNPAANAPIANGDAPAGNTFEWGLPDDLQGIDLTPGGGNTPVANAPVATTPAANLPATNNDPPNNAAAVASTEAKPKPAKPAPAQVSPSHTVTVQRGDSLWSIAERELGDPNRYPELIAPNQAKYPSLAVTPDLIQPGWTLAIPGGSVQPAPAPVVPAPKPSPKPKPQPKPVPQPPADCDPPAGKPGKPGKPTKPAKPGSKPPVGGKPVEPPVHPPEVLHPVLVGPKPPVGKPPHGPHHPSNQVAPVPVDMHGIKLQPGADMAITGQDTRVVGVGTETDTAWEVGPDGKARPVDQESRITDADTETLTRWENTNPALPPKPQAGGNIKPGQKPPVPIDMHGVAIDPLRDMEIVSQQTVLETLDTLTGTHWEVGPDGKALPTDQRTRAIGAETITRTQWAAKPGQPGGPPLPPAPPASDYERLRHDLDAYLASNKGASAITNLAANAPQYFEAATIPQKATLTWQALGDAFTNAKERQAAIAVLQTSVKQKGELLGVLNQLNERKRLDDTFENLSGSAEGKTFAKMLSDAGLFKNSGVVAAMDSDSVADYMTVLGFKHPMIGTNDSLRALPEGNKQLMIKKLLSGNFTQTDHRMATWLNQHLEKPIEIPAYDPNTNPHNR